MTRRFVTRWWPVGIGLLGCLSALAWTHHLQVLRSTHLLAQWLPLQQQVVAQQLRQTPASAWPALPWDRWSATPGVASLLVRDPNGRVVWGHTPESLPACALETADALPAACLWSVPVTDAAGVRIAAVEWTIAPHAWLAWMAPIDWALGTVWLVTMLLPVGWHEWNKLRAQRRAIRASPAEPQEILQGAGPSSAQWALGAADLVTQPVLLLDARYCLLGANAAAQADLPQLAQLLGQHCYDAVAQLPWGDRLLTTLDAVGENGPVSRYQPGTDGAPGIGVARLMAQDRCFGFWMTYDG